MLTQDQVAAYHRDGFALIEDALRPDVLARVRTWVDDVVARAKGLEGPNEVYDLEDTHTPEHPRVRRIKDPVARDPLFWEVIRDRDVIAPIQQLIGPNIRLYGSKLNLKSAGYGAPVEWHQDWAFYPHTNDDGLAVGIMLDDVTEENGPLMVLPGSHRGPIHNHHGEDGIFIGGIEDAAHKLDLAKSVQIHGRAGSMSVHHVRAIHGSALNLSGKPRRILFYEITNSDAWPLWSDVTMLKYRNYEHFVEMMICGEHSNVPRMEALPVRMPGPWKDGKVDGIFAVQQSGKQRHFGSYKEKVGAM
jgi:ectoine hydroxylase-related dioxygenase (phytanoyl-CoA dioxygenase family)